MIKNIIDADLNIYVLDRTYDYQLWETDLSHDISSDSYLGPISDCIYSVFFV